MVSDETLAAAGCAAAAGDAAPLARIAAIHAQAEVPGTARLIPVTERAPDCVSTAYAVVILSAPPHPGRCDKGERGRTDCAPQQRFPRDPTARTRGQASRSALAWRPGTGARRPRQVSGHTACSRSAYRGTKLIRLPIRDASVRSRAPVQDIRWTGMSPTKCTAELVQHVQSMQPGRCPQSARTRPEGLRRRRAVRRRAGTVPLPCCAMRHGRHRRRRCDPAARARASGKRNQIAASTAARVSGPCRAASKRRK